MPSHGLESLINAVSCQRGDLKVVKAIIFGKSFSLVIGDLSPT